MMSLSLVSQDEILFVGCRRGSQQDEIFLALLCVRECVKVRSERERDQREKGRRGGAVVRESSSIIFVIIILHIFVRRKKEWRCDQLTCCVCFCRLFFSLFLSTLFYSPDLICVVGYGWYCVCSKIK